jgi:hypothetical protein
LAFSLALFIQSPLRSWPSSLCRRRLSVSSGNIALGVTAAVISQTAFFPLGTLFFSLEPYSPNVHFQLLFSYLIQYAWTAFLHQVMRYAFLRFLTTGAPDDGPGMAYG